MKKLYFLFIILLVTTCCFGQNWGDGKTNWSNSIQAPCFSNLSFAFMSQGYVPSVNAYAYNWRIENKSTKRVSFSIQPWIISADNKYKEKMLGGLFVLDPGETYTHTTGYNKVLPKGSSAEFHIYSYSDEKGGPSYDCRDGQKICFSNCNVPNAVSSNQQGNNITVNQTNTKSINDQIDARLQKKDDLCSQLSKTNTQSSICNKTSADYMTGLTGTETQVNNRKYTILADINADIYELESLLRQASEKQKAAEIAQQEAEVKQKKFGDLITQGDKSFNNKSYDYAMGYYTQAQNMATNDGEKNIASQKYNQAAEAKRTAARTTRVAEVKQKDKTEDATYTAAAGSAAAVMSMLNDGYTHSGFSAKFQMGVGYDQTPMITNQNNSNAAAASYADKASYPLVGIGLKFEILNNAPVNINLGGIYTAGLHAFETGITGVHTVIGGEGGIQFWYKTATKFKLFADFGWYQRTGERKRDQDAVTGGTSATDDVREGKYNYNVIRFGFGPMLHFRKGGRETWIKPGVYFDKVSFAKEDKPKMLFSLKTNIASSIIIEATYSQNYPVAGTISYPNAFHVANQDYFSIKLIRQGNLF
jgi:hypothetical protein